MPFRIAVTSVWPIIIPDASDSSAGLMSAADKTKLDGLSPGGSSQAFYGDGSDGAGTFDGVATPTGSTRNSATSYTLNRDVNYTTLSVSAPVTVHTNGFRLLSNVSGGVNNGTIDNSATSITGAAAGTLLGGSAGGLGGSGGGSGANGSAATNSIGGAGGNGGTLGKTGFGGAVTAPSAAKGRWRNTFSALWGTVSGISGGAAALTALTGGAGGGGGGAGVPDNSGDGGGGGGAVVVTNPALVNNGVISANGAPGAGASGVGSGGGGGGGGWVGVITGSLTGSGSIVANGGAGGAVSGMGNPGVAGANGTVLIESS